MRLEFRNNYEGMTDRQLVEKVTKVPFGEFTNRNIMLTSHKYSICEQLEKSLLKQSIQKFNIINQRHSLW